MEERPEDGMGAADEEPLATAFERLSSVMAGDHDWADEAEDDEGVPSSELFADILPDQPDTRDDADLRVAELPSDARLSVVLKNCPQIFGPREVTRLFSGIPVADIQVLRPPEGGKVCCVDFLDRRDLAEALRRSPEDIGKAGVEILLAAEDDSFEKLLQDLQPSAQPPPSGPAHGHGPGGQFPPGRAPYPPPDHAPLPGSSGRSHPPGGGGGGGYGAAAGPPRDNHHHHGPPMGPGRGYGQGPQPDNRGPMHDGGPRSSFEGRRMDRPPQQRRSFEEGPQRGGRGNAWRPYDGPQQHRGPPGGIPHLGHGPPPPPHGHPVPPGGPGGRGPGGPGGFHGPPPPRWMDGGPGGGPGGGMGPYGGTPDHRMGPRGPPMQQHGPPPPGHPHGPPQHHPMEPPPSAAAAASERPRLKLAPRTKPIGEEGGTSSSAAGSTGKPNPFGSAKPIDTAAKLEEIEKKHHMAEVEVQHPHSHKPSEPPAPDLFHSALVDPPSAAVSGLPRKILSPPPKGAAAAPPPPGLHRPPGL